MNESEEITSAEEGCVSLNASSAFGKHEPLLNMIDSSVIIVEEDPLSMTISSTPEEDQTELNDNFVKGEEITAAAYCGEESLFEGDIPDGGGTASLNNVANGFNTDLVNKTGNSASSNGVIPAEVHNLYEEITVLDKLVENKIAFKREFCLNVCEPKTGVILTQCLHSFCKKCITRIIKTANDIEIKCPYRDHKYVCEMFIPHHEIKEIIGPKDFDNFIQKSITIATGGEPINNDGGDGEASGSLYQNLVALNEKNLVENQESFKCEVCQTECEQKAGVILSECIHSICKECIKAIVETTDDVEIKCPFRDLEYACDTIIPHREIKEVCGAVIFEKFLERSLTVVCCLEEEPMPIKKVEEKIDTALYKELMVLGDQLLVENQEAFNCGVCLDECSPKAGVVIAECLHAFCKQCIATLVEMATDAEIHCPFRDTQYSCEKVILHREIKQIVSQEVFDNFLEKSFSITMRSMTDARNCQFPDCKGWICIDQSDTFTCSICKRINCVLCKGLHDPQVINCEQYKRTLGNPSQFSENFLSSMVNARKAMLCPSCGVVIQKVDGCDGIKCTRCKMEICWATRGPRWGPRGLGDTSGGCRCKVNDGKKCHPDCNNCH